MVKKIRKGLAIILVASMIMSMLQLTTFAAGELGDGTPGNPYQIGATVKGGETEPERFCRHGSFSLVIRGKGGEESAIKSAAKGDVIFQHLVVVDGRGGIFDLQKGKSEKRGIEVKVGGKIG